MACEFTVKTVSTNGLFKKGEYQGTLKLKATPNHKKNTVKFDVLGYQGKVNPNSGYDSCTWSIPIVVEVGLGKDYASAKTNAKIFYIQMSNRPETGAYPTSFQSFGYTTYVGDEGATDTKNATKKYFSQCSYTASCNDWGTPEVVLYFRCQQSCKGVDDKLVSGELNSSINVEAGYNYLTDLFPHFAVREGISASLTASDPSESNVVVTLPVTLSITKDTYSENEYINHKEAISIGDYVYMGSWNEGMYPGGSFSVSTSPSVSVTEGFTFNHTWKKDSAGSSEGSLAIGAQNTTYSATATHNINGKTTTISGTYDLRIPTITLDAIEITSNSSISVPISATVGASDQCYITKVQYRIDGGSWSDPSESNDASLSDYKDKGNKPGTASKFCSVTLNISGISEGSHTLEVRATRESNKIIGYSSSKKFSLIPPKCTSNPVLTFTSPTQASITFVASKNCNYSLYINGSLYKGPTGCSGKTPITINNIEWTHTASDKFELYLQADTLSSTNNTLTDIDCRIPNFSAGPTIKLLKATGEFKLDYKVDKYSGYTPNVSITKGNTPITNKLIVNSIENYIIKLYRTNPDTSNIKGYSNLCSTTDISIDTQIPELKNLICTQKGDKYSFSVSVYKKGTPDLLKGCKFSYKLVNIQTNAVEDSGESDITVSEATLARSNKQVPIGPRCKLCIEVKYSTNGLTDLISYQEIVLTNIVYFFDEKGNKQAGIAFICNGKTSGTTEDKWDLAFPYICNKKKKWKETTN